MTADAMMTPAMYALAAIADANQTAGAKMTTTRTRIAAQDAILAAIVKAAKDAPNENIRAAIKAEGAALGKKWNVLHPDLGLPAARIAGQ